MSRKAIRAAIETRLGDWAAGVDYPVAWENAAFTPPASVWLAFTLLPADTRGTDLGGTLVEYRGVAQIDVAVPSGNGPKLAEEIIGELETLFPPDTYLDADGVSVIVLTPLSSGPGRADASHYIVPCSFTYRADVAL